MQAGRQGGRQTTAGKVGGSGRQGLFWHRSTLTYNLLPCLGRCVPHAWLLGSGDLMPPRALRSRGSAGPHDAQHFIRQPKNRTFLERVRGK